MAILHERAAPAVPHQADPVRPALLLAALGVVFGDIGTSPIYAFREGLGGEHGAGADPVAVLGLLSMIFWAVTLVVTVKYVALVLRADNDGEGGILALLAGVLRQVPAAGAWRTRAIYAGLFGAAMFYGDAIITPAISVLSAVEGLETVSPALEPFVVPLTLAILAGLFAVQRFGTAGIGRVFGPVMITWFATLALLGLAQIAQHPAVLSALSPLAALHFAIERPQAAALVVGAVFLAVTGGEALYADLGHFGLRPIRAAWLWIVMPSLVLNYFGQGALVLRQPAAAENPFFLLAPELLRLPLVLLAGAATVIASQAVLAGAYSLTVQAARLGLMPRLTIRYTSATEAGQIYVPAVNWVLFVGVVALVIGFGSSSALAAAYGIAVSLTMVVTTLGVTVIAARRWAWGPTRIALVLGPLLALDLVFVTANSVKIAQGGWLPLVFGALVLLLLATWARGRELMLRELKRGGLAIEPFVRSLTQYPPPRVEGTAVFMTPPGGVVPQSLLHNLKHNRVLHARVLLLSTETQNMPHVPPAEMVQLTDLGDGCWRARVKLGFRDPHDIDCIGHVLYKHHDFELVPRETSFFLSRQTLLVERQGGMAMWRKRLFAWMQRSSLPASDFFRIPPNRMIEIGTQLTI